MANDNDRHCYVINDEGFNTQYEQWKKHNAGGMRAYLKKNRETIDKAMEDVRTGQKRSHFLTYG